MSPWDLLYFEHISDDVGCPVQDWGYDEDDKKHRERDRGKKPCRIADEQEKECSCDKIILVRDRPFRPPFLSIPAFEEALGQIPEKCTGGEQDDGQECVLRQIRKGEPAVKPDQDEPGHD